MFLLGHSLSQSTTPRATTYITRKTYNRVRSTAIPGWWSRRKVLAEAQDNERLQVVFVSTEVAPWSKVGGLGDVISALPAALAARGHRVMTVSPRYVASPEEEDTGIVVPVQLGRATRNAAEAGDRCMVLGKDKEAHWVKYYWTHRDGVDHLFVDHPLYLQDGGGGGGGGGRGGGGGDGGMGSQRIYSYCHGQEYCDLPGRYSILCQAALAIPSIFWETALMTPERKDPETHVQGGTQERSCPDTSAWHIVNGIAQKLSDMTSLTAKRAGLQPIRPSCRAERSLNTSHQEDGLHETGDGMLRYYRSVTFVGNDWPCSLLPLWLQYYRMCHTAANSKLPGVAAQHEHQPASTAFPPVLTALEASSRSELAYKSDDMPDDVDDVQEAPGPHDCDMGALDRHGSTDNLQETSTLAVDYLTDPDLTVSALLQEFAEYEAEAQRELDFMQQLHDHYHLLASFLEKRRQSGERQHPSVSEPRPSASFVVDDDQGDITLGAEVLQEGGGVNQQRPINQSDLITADQTDRLSLTASTIAEDERSLDSPQGSELWGEYGGQPASVQGDTIGHPLGGLNCARLAINDTSQGGDVFMSMSGVQLTSMQEPPEVPTDLDKSDDLLSSSMRDSDYIPPAASPVSSRGGFLFKGGEDSGKQALGVGGSHAKGSPPTEMGKHVSDPSRGFPEPLWTGTEDTKFDWVKVEENKGVPYVRPDGPTYRAHDEAAVQAGASLRGLSIVDSDSNPEARGTELRRERKFDCSYLSSSRASCQLSRLQAKLGRRLGDAHVAMAIHNMIYQGKFPVSEFSRTGLPLNFCPPFLNHTQVWAAREVKTTELPLEQLLEAVGCHTLQKHKVPEKMLNGRQAVCNCSGGPGPTSWTSSVRGSPLLTEEQHNDSMGPNTAHQVAKLSPQEEDTSMVNWLKAALVTSDALVTVSQGYAQDLLGSCPLGLYDSSKVTGLETALEDDLSLVLSGRGLGSILNGLDTKAWDPQSDPYLPEGCRYDSDTVTQGKAAAKQFVQGLLGLEPDASVALVVFLGRLEPQKGADIVLAALPELLQATKEGGGVDLERPSGSPLLGGQDVTDRDTEDRDNADDALEKPSGTVAEAPHQDPLPPSSARRIDIAEYASQNPPCCEDAPLTFHLGLTSVVINKQKFPSGILSATPACHVHQGDHKEPTDVEEGKTGSGRPRQTARNPDVATAMTSGKCQVVMLGRGRAWLETRLSALAKRYPGTACGVAQFDEGLAHQLMAAADYLLVPSRSEPCGLVALSALRYGTIPIVTPVGGLRDIVDPGVGYLLPPVGSATNSLQFRDGVRGLVEGVRQALQDFDTAEFHRRRRVSMAMEVCWENPAGQWEQLLSGLAHPPHLETG